MARRFIASLPTSTERSHASATGRSSIRHVYIRPRTPRLNGKVERSHRIDDQEFYQLLDKDGISDDIHLFNEKLREWEDYYNYHRPHRALDGQTPYDRLVAKLRPGSLPAS
jgi:transposase InsO family protein